MRTGYVKEFEGGKEVWKMRDPAGHTGREVETGEWDIGSYITYCLFPISSCIKRMGEMEEEGSKIGEYAVILDRLYDAAYAQLGKMEDAIYKDRGYVRIVTTNEYCRGGFLQQDFLEVYVKDKPE